MKKHNTTPGLIGVAAFIIAFYLLSLFTFGYLILIIADKFFTLPEYFDKTWLIIFLW